MTRNQSIAANQLNRLIHDLAGRFRRENLHHHDLSFCSVSTLGLPGNRNNLERDALQIGTESINCVLYAYIKEP